MTRNEEMPQPEQPVSDLLRRMTGNVEEIIRSEIELARAETIIKAVRLVKESRTLCAGIVFAIYALGLMLLSCVYTLSLVVPF